MGATEEGLGDPLAALAAVLPRIYEGRFRSVAAGSWVVTAADGKPFPASMLAVDRDGAYHLAAIFDVDAAEATILVREHPRYPLIARAQVAGAFAWLDRSGTTDALACVVDTLAWRRVGRGDRLAPMGGAWQATQAVRAGDRLPFAALPVRATCRPT